MSEVTDMFDMFMAEESSEMDWWQMVKMQVLWMEWRVAFLDLGGVSRGGIAGCYDDDYGHDRWVSTTECVKQSVQSPAYNIQNIEHRTQSACLCPSQIDTHVSHPIPCLDDR